VGVNTEEMKDSKVIRKKGKENDKGRSTSKLYPVASLSKEKSRPKLEKDKKSMLETVKEEQKIRPESQESEIVQSMRLSEQISYSKDLSESSNKHAQLKRDETRNSEILGDRTTSKELIKEGRLTDNQHRNKMVSIFNNQSPLEA
jgi:hypothetical protein